MTPVDYIHIDLKTMRLKLSDKGKMLHALIKSFNSHGLTMSNAQLSELLCCNQDNICRLLRENKPYIRIENPQSRYRKIFYSGENDEVKIDLLQQKSRSRNKFTPANKQPTPTIKQPTPAKMTDKTKETKETNNNIYSQTSAEYKLAELLLNLILERKSDYKKPNLQSWSKHIDRMLRLDHRQPDRIESVIRWCQADLFWRTNILSTSKLREKFDRLELQMDQKNERTQKNIRDFNRQRSDIGITVEV